MFHCGFIPSWLTPTITCSGSQPGNRQLAAQVRQKNDDDAYNWCTRSLEMCQFYPPNCLCLEMVLADSFRYRPTRTLFSADCIASILLWLWRRSGSGVTESRAPRKYVECSCCSYRPCSYRVNSVMQKDIQLLPDFFRTTKG